VSWPELCFVSLDCKSSVRGGLLRATAAVQLMLCIAGYAAVFLGLDQALLPVKKIMSSVWQGWLCLPLLLFCASPIAAWE
jgi:hypothetical protein